MKNIFFCNSFYANARHGGGSRTRQHIAMLSGQYNVFQIQPVYSRNSVYLLKSFKAVMLLLRVFFLFEPVYGIRKALDWAIKNAAVHTLLSRCESDHGTPSMCVVEDSRMVMATRDFKARGIPVVIMSHNLNAFSHNKNGFHVEPMKELNLEIGLYAQSSLVVTISTEEAWLLRNTGIHAVFLPYVPQEDKSAIHENNGDTEPSPLPSHNLMLGSAFNRPTALGMEDVLSAARMRNGSFTFPMVIAGKGVEQLEGAADVNPAKITLAGEVSDQALEVLLKNTNALLVHQNCGAGALTRIVDWGLAGIPVICTPHAARSAPALDNITVVNSVDEMLDLAETIQPRKGPRPIPEAWKKQISHVSRVLQAMTSSIHESGN